MSRVICYGAVFPGKRAIVQATKRFLDKKECCKTQSPCKLWCVRLDICHSLRVSAILQHPLPSKVQKICSTAHQPLIPCILIPSTKYFWQRKKMISTGIVMTTATAIIWPILVVPIEEFKNWIPMATVNFFVELR